MARGDAGELTYKVRTEIREGIEGLKQYSKAAQKSLEIKTENPAIKKMQDDLVKTEKEVDTLGDKLKTKLFGDRTASAVRKQFISSLDGSGNKVPGILEQMNKIKEATNPEELEEYANQLHRIINMRVGSLASEKRKGGPLGNAAELQLQANNMVDAMVDAQKQSLNIEQQFNDIATAERKATEGVENFEEAIKETGNEAKDTFNDVEESIEGVGTAAEDAKSKAQEAFDAIKESTEGLEDFGLDLNADVTKMDFASLDEYKRSITDILNLISKLGLQDEFRDFFNRGTEALTRTNTQISILKGDIREVQKEIQKEPPKLTFGVDADVANMSIQQLVQHLSELQARMKFVGEGSAEFKPMYDAAIRASNAIRAYRQSFNGTGDKAKSEMQRVRTAMNLASKGVALIKNALKSVESAFHKLATVAKNVAKKIFSTFKSVASTVSGLVKSAFDKLGKSTESAFSSRNLKRTLTMLTKYIFGVRSFFFLYRKLRKLVGEGLENLVQFESATNETNHAITELRTSLLFIKNAWAAAFAPIINVVYPILVGLMDMLASVGNAIARFVAALTGKATVLQAVRVSAGDYADSLSDAGKGAGKAADEQEKLNNKLAAFDDLNVLGIDDEDDPNKGKGGGGGADDLLDPNTMFERIATPMSDLAKLIQEAWETGNAFKLGEFFANRFSESLDKAYEWLTGEGRSKVMKIGGLIGSFIDGWLSVDDLGTKFGKVIGEAFVLAMDFINIIITPDRALKIGTQIADALNAAIPLIVPKIGETMGNLFRSAISGAWGFLTTADFKGWGEAISSAINNFITEMNQEVTITTAKGNLQWAGKVSHTGLNGWEMLGQDVTLLAQGMIDMLGEAIGGADWKELGKGLGKVIENIDISAIKDSLKKLWDKIKTAFSELWAGFKEESPDTASGIEGFFKGAIDMIPDLIALAAVIGSISGAISLISGAMSIAFPLISALLPYITAGTLVTELGALAGALSPIAVAIVLIGGAIIGVIESLASFRAGLDDGSEGSVGLYGHLQMLFGGALPTLIYWISYAYGSLGKLKGAFELAKVAIFTTLSSISEKFAIVFLAARTIWITFKSTIIRGIENITDNFASFGTFLVTLFSGDVRGALNVAIEAIETFLNSCIQGIAEFANSPALGGIAGLAGRTISNVSATTITLPRIPALAQGAVIPPNNRFLAMLGDQTSGTNIEAPLDTIKQAVGEEFAPYADAIVEAVMQVVQAVNNKPVLSDKDIGQANSRYVGRQRIIRGTML